MYKLKFLFISIHILLLVNCQEKKEVEVIIANKSNNMIDSIIVPPLCVEKEYKFIDKIASDSLKKITFREQSVPSGEMPCLLNIYTNHQQISANWGFQDFSYIYKYSDTIYIYDKFASNYLNPFVWLKIETGKGVQIDSIYSNANKVILEINKYSAAWRVKLDFFKIKEDSILYIHSNNAKHILSLKNYWKDKPEREKVFKLKSN